MDAGRKRLLFHCLWNLIIVITLVFIFFPFLWLLMTALKLPVDAFALPPVWIFTPTLANLVQIVKEGFLVAYWNSMIIAFFSTLISLVIGVPAGYSLARARFRGKTIMSSYLLLARLAPPVAFSIPLYMLYRRLDLTDTHLGLILANLTITLPFVVWIMAGFFKGIPEDLEEAAIIDGCSKFGALIRVIIPLSGPGLATASIFSLFMSWNQYYYPLILGGRNSITAPLVIQKFVSFEGLNWGQLAASGLLVVFPVLLFTFIAQKGIVQGLMRGAIK